MIRGLTKTHKPSTPVRPITSGFDSALHRLMKRLAKPINNAIGTIISSHLKNAADLINRLRELDFSNKRLITFNAIPLFINVFVDGALKAIRRATSLNDEYLTPTKRDYTKTVFLYMNFGAFTFEGEEFLQCRGLAMGPPISVAAASHYMAVSEKEEFKGI